VTEPQLLTPAPRRVRPGPVLRRRRRLAVLVATLIALVGLTALGIALVPRVDLLRRGVPATGRIFGHHITERRAPLYTLFVRLPNAMGGGTTRVDVDPATYDRLWIGDEVAFYVDPLDHAVTSQDPPSALKLFGFALQWLAFLAVFVGIPFVIGWELTAEQKEERRQLVELEAGILEITASRPSETLPPNYVVSGRVVERPGKRYRTENLRVGHPVAVGDRIPILIDPEKNFVRAVSTYTSFEPLPTKPT
jgi:hypothetical protein